MDRSEMKMLDPIFAPGESKVAIATFPVRPAGLACAAELWLSRDGTTKDATSGAIPFTSTGVDQSISCPVTMPAGGYAYRALLDVTTDGIRIAVYEADEPVVVPWVGLPEITW